MKLKTFTAFIITTMVLTAANAVEIDLSLKKQCLHIVHNTGTSDPQYNAYLLGVISGIEYLIKNPSNFAGDASYTKKRYKTCKKALNNTTESGFNNDYKREAVLLLSKPQ